MRTIVICAALALAGCATKWDKPGGSEQEFHGDMFACQQAAAAAFPNTPISFGGGYQAPSHTSCTGFGPTLNCTTTPGQKVAPAQIDGNMVHRQRAVESCLMSKGYTKR